MGGWSHSEHEFGAVLDGAGISDCALLVCAWSAVAQLGRSRKQVNPFLVHLCREESSFCRLCFRGAQADERSDLALPGRGKRSDMGAVESIVAHGLGDHRPNQCPIDST